MLLYSVSDLIGYVRQRIESDLLLGELWVSGEVSNLSHSAAGHYYFSLKDSDSQMRCVMFRPAIGATTLRDGLTVMVHGRVSVYEVRGDLQIYGDFVKEQGIGDDQLEIDRLKLTLESEGLFDSSRKRALPKFPSRIGVITSEFGSVWHDIGNVIGRRFPATELVLVHTNVQGDGSVDGIIGAFKIMNTQPDIDVVILARGGGSLEDLSSFNNEEVARIIYSSRSPVISAVGHETDVTIADLVADVRAPTPSAAAELVVPDVREFNERLEVISMSLIQFTMNHVVRRTDNVRQVSRDLHRFKPDVSNLRQRIDDLGNISKRNVLSSIFSYSERTNAMVSRINSLNPTNVLARGYAVVQNQKDFKLMKSIHQAQQGDIINVELSDGTVRAEVLGIEAQEQYNMQQRLDL